LIVKLPIIDRSVGGHIVINIRCHSAHDFPSRIQG
jgi:hypothetical protein